MKKNQQVKGNQQVSQNDRARIRILKKLFGKLDKKEVWNAFPDLLRGKIHSCPSAETLKRVRRAKRKIERRIQKFYPSDINKLRVILRSDTKLMHHVIHSMWVFSDTHEGYAENVVVISGSTMKKLLLNFTALAVVALLLWYTKKANDDSPFPNHIVD